MISTGLLNYRAPIFQYHIRYTISHPFLQQAHRRHYFKGQGSQCQIGISIPIQITGGQSDPTAQLYLRKGIGRIVLISPVFQQQKSSLAVLYHEEGFLQPDGSSGFDYFYYLRDHLSNTRLIVQDANSNGSLDTTEIVQENHYYPFGMQMQGDWMGSNVDNYTY